MSTDREYIKLFTTEEEINLFLQENETENSSFIVISTLDISNELCLELIECGAIRIYKGLTEDKINEVIENVRNSGKRKEN